MRQNDIKVFLDLDGLGADWEGYVMRRHFPHYNTIEELNAQPNRPELIRNMYREDPSLFLKLPPIPQFDIVLWWLQHSPVEWAILTAIGSDHFNPELAKRHKLQFLLTEFGVPARRVITCSESRHKQRFAGRGRVLVDDYWRNIEEWECAKGSGVLVPAKVYDAQEVVNRIKSVLQKIVA